MSKFLLYGANGYTAGLIIQIANEYGLTPVLAGRNKEKVTALAKEHGLESRIFDLSDTSTIVKQLTDFKVVLHCAGPFMYTAKPMMKACLEAGVHYLDITGEITVFERGFRNNQKALDKNIMIMPGVGFDVVPTDCMAAYLKQRLPDATHLELAIGSIGGGVSRGTATTMIENAGESGAIREDGIIKPVAPGFKTRRIPYYHKELLGVTIPWGDVSSAFHTTGIPNILVYMAIRPKALRFIKMQRYAGWLLKRTFVKNRLKKRIQNRKPGPTDEQRQNGNCLVWGEATNLKGDTVAANFKGPEGYTLTAHTALLITKKVLAGNWKPGFQTPAKAYGADLVMELNDTVRKDL